MKLQLLRTTFTDKSTIGMLSIDGVFFCFTLELPVKDGLPGSAIPEGTYNVVSLLSPRFNRNMPHIQDIPNRSSILIHWGNYPHDTQGCVLIGKVRGIDMVAGSRAAFDEFWPKFMQALGRDSVSIDVLGNSNHEAVQQAVTGEN